MSLIVIMVSTLLFVVQVFVGGFVLGALRSYRSCVRSVLRTFESCVCSSRCWNRRWHLERHARLGSYVPAVSKQFRVTLRSVGLLWCQRLRVAACSGMSVWSIFSDVGPAPLCSAVIHVAWRHHSRFAGFLMVATAIWFGSALAPLERVAGSETADDWDSLYTFWVETPVSCAVHGDCPTLDNTRSPLTIGAPWHFSTATCASARRATA